jgi:hypothetical protein
MLSVKLAIRIRILMKFEEMKVSVKLQWTFKDFHK